MIEYRCFGNLIVNFNLPFVSITANIEIDKGDFL